jgi:hypothetical protein
LIILASSCDISKNISTSTLQYTTAISSSNGLSIPLKTQTLTNAFLASSTNTILSTFTKLTHLEPTLQHDAAQAKLLELLFNNGNCRLPCFWGIYPGITGPDAAIQVLYPLSSISGLTSLDNESGTIHPIYKIEELIYRFHISYEVEKGKIKLLHLYAYAENEKSDEFIFDSDYFGNLIAYYSLSGVMDRYGRPSSILLKTQLSSITGNIYQMFDILLIYPAQGIIVNYTTKSHISGKDIIACLENSHINLALLPSKNEAGVDEYLSQRWYDELPSYKPLEEVTGLSNDDFYIIFKASPTQCIKTQVDLWPTIDR